MIAHREEIYSRPKKTWFVTETEKKLAAKAAKVILSDQGSLHLDKCLIYGNLLVYYQ